MKFYSGTGDKGETSLYGGGRVSKNSLRMDAIGSVDELNSAVGMARSRIEDGDIRRLLEELQEDLFEIGADIATPMNAKMKVKRLEEKSVKFLEFETDKYGRETGELKHFVLPGGAPEASLLHIARSMCRRVERNIVKLSAKEEINPHVSSCVNRLSSLFFVLALAVNKMKGIKEKEWMQ